ncbi:MAG TPA: VWA domain-containing protein, partial [Candidatus Binataceae bacterium]|nr:VWA domain-containing protein [Candidatus Binataceae bacterium]
MAETNLQTGVSLHEVKGIVTKFMRMLFPLEFRVDSLTNSSVMLPFHYPLMAGEMIYLPERIETLGDDRQTRDYFIAVAAHLASRHEFGTFDLTLSDIPGFDDRGEKGAEAIDCFVASFEDPGLGGALMRLCESARVDAELRRRYRGLAPRVENLNSTLINRLNPLSLSTMLIRASLGLIGPDEYASAGFAAQAAIYFEPLREAGANVLDSTRQASAIYGWIQELIKQAREAGENPLEGADRVTNDLISAIKGGGADSGGEQMDDGESEGGEPDENVNLQVSGKSPKGGKSKALSPEELKKLLEQGAQIDPSQSSGNADGEGMYLTQLTGKQAEELEAMREQLGEIGSMSGHGRLVMSRSKQDSYFAYDEWDYVLADYRRNWCRLREVEVSGDDGDFYNNTLQRYSEMLPVIRRQFQRIRPASFRMVKGLEDGDEIDIDRTIEMRVARLMGEVPDVRVYSARKKEARDVATLFLLDMSASTDEPIHREPRKFTEGDNDDDDWMKAWQRRPQQAQRPRRIIDVNKEALIIMAQALEEIGDSYAIMGFSGHGRDNVEFYTIKEFDQELSDDVRCRIGSIEPKRSTRMGAAIRHVREKFKDVNQRSKHMILLSDGFPQDFDYGHDRRSNAYGIQDTMVALKELELAGVLPFCITVDKTGHDYLRQMCQSSRYLV